MLTLDWKSKCLKDIAPTVRVPEKNYCHKSSNALRICYWVADKVKYILLSSREEAALFFKKYGIIQSYFFTETEVKMYTYNSEIITASNGAPVWEMVQVKWEDIEITRERAFCMAVNNEFELANNTITGKIGKAIKHIFEAA